MKSKSKLFLFGMVSIVMILISSCSGTTDGNTPVATNPTTSNDLEVTLSNIPAGYTYSTLVVCDNITDMNIKATAQGTAIDGTTLKANITNITDDNYTLYVAILKSNTWNPATGADPPENTLFFLLENQTEKVQKVNANSWKTLEEIEGGTSDPKDTSSTSMVTFPSWIIGDWSHKGYNSTDSLHVVQGAITSYFLYKGDAFPTGLVGDREVNINGDTLFIIHDSGNKDVFVKLSETTIGVNLEAESGEPYNFTTYTNSVIEKPNVDLDKYKVTGVKLDTAGYWGAKDCDVCWFSYVILEWDTTNINEVEEYKIYAKKDGETKDSLVHRISSEDLRKNSTIMWPVGYKGGFVPIITGDPLYDDSYMKMGIEYSFTVSAVISNKTLGIEPSYEESEAPKSDPITVTMPVEPISSLSIYKTSFEVSTDSTVKLFNYLDADGDGISWDTTSTDTHTGNYCIGVSCNYSAKNDDWLITPEMDFSNGADSLVFWAKSTLGSYPERIEILSMPITGDNSADTTAAISITQIEDVPGEWTRYAIYISDFVDMSNNHLVFRYNADDMYELLIDDIEIK